MSEKKLFEQRKKMLLALPLVEINKKELEGLIYLSSDSLLYEPSVNLSASVVQENFSLVCLKSAEDDTGDTVVHRTEFDMCKACKSVFSNGSGGHVKRHFEQRCGSRKTEEVHKVKEVAVESRSDIRAHTQHRWSKQEQYALQKAMSKYCLRTGSSYRSLESEAMKSLIQGVLVIADKRYSHRALKKSFPCADTISKQSSELFNGQVMTNLFDLVKPYIGNGLTVAVDFGVVKECHLSVHLSFIDDITETSWKLVVIPVGLRPSYASKTPDEIHTLVTECLSPLGFKQEDIAKLFLTGDGASYNKRAGRDKFKGFIRCYNHSLHLMFERTIKPYVKAAMNIEDQIVLKNARDLMKLVRKVAFQLRSCKELKGKPISLPDPGCETRWLSFYKCVVTMVDTLDIIDIYKSLISADLWNDISKLKAK